MKILALYLPQFHAIPENNIIWGNGFTEWDNVKKAVRYKKSQNQPRIPVNGYYNLQDVSVMVEQAKMAKKYGIYGFCYYHYWINGKKIMYIPLENMLSEKKVDIPFCISWANHDWNTSPRKEKNRTFLKQEYGDKNEWIEHFKYILKFFKDDRYIRVDGKPMLLIHDAKAISCWEEMKKCWDRLALENGLQGIYYVSTLNSEGDYILAKKMKFDAVDEFQPSYMLNSTKRHFRRIFWKMKRVFFRDYLKRVSKFSYDKIWMQILKMKRPDCEEMPTFLCGFVDWDNTPRWKNMGNYYLGADEKKFRNYMNQLLKIAESRYHSEFMFINAWNEWGEGAYLEPDESKGFAYLNVIKEVSGITN